MVNPNLATGSIKARDHTTSRPFSDHVGDVINVRGMGATGDGVTDDRAAIQSAFDLAFGTAGAPHGNTNKLLNRPVYFPAGQYRINAPLYLTNVFGGHIFGDSSLTTRIGFGGGSFDGNTVVANGITPMIMTNGFCYSRMERMAISGGGNGNNNTCLYLYQDGVGECQTNQNTFFDMGFDAATAGVLNGYQSNGLCSEQTFVSCVVGQCTTGFRNISYNALNNMLINCGGFGCDECVSVPTGSMHVYNGSFAGNVIDIATGSDPMSIIGARTESANFVDTSIYAGSSLVNISTCTMAAGAGAGYFCKIGSGIKAVIDSCRQTGATSTYGKIVGADASSVVYLRGNLFDNTSFLTGFAGTVGQNI